MNTTLIRGLLCALIIISPLHAQQPSPPSDPITVEAISKLNFTPEDSAKLKELAGKVGDLAGRMLAEKLRKGGEKMPVLTTASGKQYKDVTVLKATSLDLRIIHSTGTAAIPADDLPDELREKYQFDPAAADAEAEARREAQIKYRAALAAGILFLAQRKAAPPASLEQRAQAQNKGGTALVVLGFMAVVLGVPFTGSIAVPILGCFAILIGTLVIGFSQIRVR